MYTTVCRNVHSVFCKLNSPASYYCMSTTSGIANLSLMPCSLYPYFPTQCHAAPNSDSDAILSIAQLYFIHAPVCLLQLKLGACPLISPQVSLSAFSDMIIQEVLLSGLALNYTFHGLSAGTEYTISVTAATDAGLGTQATITATTVASTVQNLETSISAPGMVHGCTYTTNCLTPVSYTIVWHYSLLYSCRVYGWHTGSGNHCTGRCSMHLVRLS